MQTLQKNLTGTLQIPALMIDVNGLCHACQSAWKDCCVARPTELAHAASPMAMAGNISTFTFVQAQKRRSERKSVHGKKTCPATTSAKEDTRHANLMTAFPAFLKPPIRPVDSPS